MRIGPYVLHGTIAAGGFGQVDYATLEGVGGFSRLVAVKRLRQDRVGSAVAAAMLVDEARIVSRIHHPNVVAVLDVVETEAELFVVMDYVDGETLAYLQRRAHAEGQSVPLPIVSTILTHALAGLHAAHEARSETGTALGIIHRDVSPQNIMVSAQGQALVLDFGIAKATARLQQTATGEVKGKIAYMAPEQLAGEAVTRRADLYAVAVVLWELVTGRRLFGEADVEATIERVLLGYVDPPSKFVPAIPEDLESVILRGLARDPAARFATAREMQQALVACAPLAAPSEVAAWVERLAAESLSRRRPEVERLTTRISARLAPPVDEAATLRDEPAPRTSRRWIVALAVATSLVLASLVAWRPKTRADASDSGPAKGLVMAPPAEVLSVDAPADASVLERPGDDATAPLETLAKKKQAPHRPARAKVDCSIPFVIDTSGMRIYKRECLAQR